MPKQEEPACGGCPCFCIWQSAVRFPNYFEATLLTRERQRNLESRIGGAVVRDDGFEIRHCLADQRLQGFPSVAAALYAGMITATLGMFRRGLQDRASAVHTDGAGHWHLEVFLHVAVLNANDPPGPGLGATLGKVNFYEVSLC
jgi:hypothetical protein